MSVLKRRTSSSATQGGSPSFVADAADAGRWPGVMEFLALEQWGPDQPRTPGSLLFFVEGGSLKLMLNDKDAGQVLFLSGSSLSDLFDAAEAILAMGNGDWRVSKVSPPKKR